MIEKRLVVGRCVCRAVLHRPGRVFSSSVMAKSKFEYVRSFEEEVRCLRNCWVVVRLDGRGFHSFTQSHDFARPNDARGLRLMSRAAASVMRLLSDVRLAFGHSDEYSFVLSKDARIFNRRRDKILSLVASSFSSAYVFHWSRYFQLPLQYPPCFDARIVLYPSDQNLRDYLSWRQADVHINNLYNTCFWALVLKKHMTPQQAEESLRGTVSSQKNELLYQEFKMNYNEEEAMFRKGTILLRKLVALDQRQPTTLILPFHSDLIGDAFWTEHAEILSLAKTPIYEPSQPLHEYYLATTQPSP